MNQDQFLRKWSLVVADVTGNGIDLSELRIKFTILQSDEESPNTANIRVYNLSEATVKKITSLTPVEYNRVVLQAGYQDGNFGIIFDGTIRQFRRGRENNIDSYLDILAAEGDIPFEFSYVQQPLAAGWKQSDAISAATKAMGLKENIVTDSNGLLGGTNPRGKVLWGLARVALRSATQSVGSTWSINNGTVQVIPLQGYLPNEAIVLNAKTGMIGVPEQTDEGIRVKCLLNPKLIIGGRIQIDNASINQLTQQGAGMAGLDSPLSVGQITFNSITGEVQLPASVAADGMYRVYVVEYEGDTRGNPWYANIIALAIDPSNNKVIAKN